MMHYEPRFDIFTLFLLLGFSQGLLLSFYFLFKRKNRLPIDTLYGLALLTLTILVSEILLNYTGIIVKVIFIENYSEPFIFLLFPLIYLIFRNFYNVPFSPEDKIHFLPFVFYFLYCFLYFAQPPEFKYNSYVYCYQPDWSYIDVNSTIPEDPLRIRKSLAILYLTQNIIYLILIFYLIKGRAKNNQNSISKSLLRNLKISYGIFVFITVLLLFVKIHFERDLGDYIIGTVLSILLYTTSILILRNTGSSIDFTNQDIKPKYEKSALSDDKKEEILSKITNLMVKEKYFTRNTLTLAEVSKKVNEPPHHVSQVINEKLKKSFFDLLSEYRVEESKLLITDKSTINLTIEEIAERVGYNSKAAFNKAFKKYTGRTPSEFRKRN